MTKLLPRLGFVYKKPKLVPAKAALAKQQLFLAEYLRLKKEKQPEELDLLPGGYSSPT